jgi:hypothetical protein
MDGKGKPTPIPSVIAETADEKRRYDEAGLRRDARLSSCAPEVNR